MVGLDDESCYTSDGCSQLSNGAKALSPAGVDESAFENHTIPNGQECSLHLVTECRPHRDADVELRVRVQTLR